MWISRIRRRRSPPRSKHSGIDGAWSCWGVVATAIRTNASPWGSRRPETLMWSSPQTTTRDQRTLTTEVIDGADRRSAIRTALQLAGKGDVVAILGKGHELGQEIAGTVLPFSDAVVASEEWALLHPDLAEPAGQQGTTP